MGFFNKGIKSAEDIANKKLTNINGRVGGGIGAAIGTVSGGIIGETADDINDIYYKGKPNQYNSSYNAVGFIAGGVLGIGIGRHYARKATSGLISGKWSSGKAKFDDFIMTKVD